MGKHEEDVGLIGAFDCTGIAPSWLRDRSVLMLPRNMFDPSGRLPGHEFDALSGQIIGAALAVHQALGPGFAEAAYQNAMCVALGNRHLAYETQRMILIHFEGVEVGRYWLDLVISNQIVLELKAVKSLADIHHAQIRACLKASRLPIELLMNFNEPVLKVRRFVN